jgi:multicomponent Na+:H+ antiporter subunit C
MSVLLAFTAAVLFGLGTWLLTQRRLTRIIIGIGLIGHGTNLLLVTSGGDAGLPPIIDRGDPDDFADPLPQALALTSIVITFGISAYLLALAYRAWQLNHDDIVRDDIEDRMVATGRFVDPDLTDAEEADFERAGDSSGDIDDREDGGVEGPGTGDAE